MTRVGTWIAYVVAMAAPACCLTWIVAWRAAIPEPWAWRRELGMRPLVFLSEDWAVFEDAPNLVLLRWLRLESLYAPWGELGQGVFVGFVLAVVMWLGLRHLARRAIGRGPVLAWVMAATAVLLFTPALGATWIVGERWRVLVPACVVVWGCVLLAGGEAWRWRVAAAAALSSAAAFIDETGVWCWIALAPLVVLEARRRERGVAATVASWVLLGNVVAFCSRLDSGPAVRMDVTDAGVWKLFFEAAGQCFAGSSVVDASVVGCALVGVLVVGLALVAMRRNAVAPAGPWVAIAGFGVLSAAHASGRLADVATPATWMAELHPGLLLLPVGALGLLAALGWTRRGAVFALVVACVACGSAWPVGFHHLRHRSEALGQAHGRLVFGQFPGLGVVIDPELQVLFGETELRRLVRDGVGRSLRPIETLEVARFKHENGTAGEITSVEPGLAQGRLFRGGFERMVDLIALSVAVDGTADERIVSVSGPRASMDADAVIWSATIPELPPGSRLRAWGFDARSRTLRPLAGSYRVAEDGRIVEAGS